MKKIFIIFAFLLSAFNAFADGVSANDVTLTNDDTASLDISLDNSLADIVGLQFNLTLPEGITPVMDGSKVVITPSDRLKGAYTLRGSKVSDGSYLFTFLSNDRTPIEGNTGKLFSLALQNSSAADGSYSANITNVITTDLGGNGQSLTDFSFSITVVHSYKLTYKVDGNVYKEYTLNYGDAITPEAEPTKEGYTFSGWGEIPATMPAHDVEVNGSFTINQYKVTFISDGTIIKEETLDYGTQIVSPANPTKLGHTFTGWNPAVDATVPAHDVTYMAQFSVNQYTITFDTDGGSAVVPITLNYGAVITKPANPTKEGFTFAGWNPAIPETMPAENMTIKATWSINSYKLTYKVDGNVYKEYTLNYGAVITPEAEPTKEGYIFSGWSEIPQTMPAYDVDVVGSFTKGAYSLKYYVDNELYQTFGYDYQEDIVPIDKPVREGYSFSDWTGFPDDMKMPAHDVRVDCISLINSYKLSYIVDGDIYKEYTLEYNSTITLEADPTKEGYTFSGWSGYPADMKMPARDVEVDGSFEVNHYKVLYYVDDECVHQDEIAFGDTFELWVYIPENSDMVFNGWIGEEYETMPAHDISYRADITNGITYVYNNPENVLGIYTLDGKKVEKIHPGVYVIRMKNGSTRKILLK